LADLKLTCALILLTSFSLVTFSSDVTVYVPGTTPVVVSGDKLNKTDDLLNSAQALADKFKTTIKDSQAKLIDIVKSLSEGGMHTVFNGFLFLSALIQSCRWYRSRPRAPHEHWPLWFWLVGCVVHWFV